MKNLFFYSALCALASFALPQSAHTQWACQWPNGVPTSIYTPRSSQVNGACYYSTEYFAQWQINQWNIQIPQQWPQATYVSTATGKYNCHSRAFYQDSPNNSVGINANPDVYWWDGSYTYPSSEIFATTWSYWNGGHSALAFPLGQASTVRSKWGAWPFMYHVKTYCPYMPQYGGTTTQIVAFESCPISTNTCKAPGLFWSTNVSNTSVVLNWTRACNASQYQMQYRLNGGSTWYILYTANAPTIPHFILTLNVGGMTPNKCYDFRLKVINGTGSAYSTIETVCTNAQRLAEISNHFNGEPSAYLGEMVIPKAGDIVPTEALDSTPTFTFAVSGYQISATQVSENARYVLANSLGQVVCQGKATEGTIQCTVEIPGIYFVSIVDRAGNRYVQKVFVN